MLSRELLYGQEGRARLKKGFDALAKMVAVTLGPKGRNVIIDKHYGGPQITKDGVTVAKEIFLKDVVENMGAELVRSVASKTAEVAGDGTTTATVLAQAIVTEGLKNVTAGANPMDLKRGIDLAVKEVVRYLQEVVKRDVETDEEIVQVGTISANGDKEIGKLLSDAMNAVGKSGVITVEDSKSFDTNLEVVEGMQFDRGYLSHYFITNIEKMEAELADVTIIMYSGRLDAIEILLPILNQLGPKGKPILVVADDIGPDVMKILVYNRMKSGLQICATKAPGFGDRRLEMLEDLAIVTGGKVVSPELNLSKTTVVTTQDLGHAGRVVVTRESTTLVDGAGLATTITSRVEAIKRQIEACTSDYDKQKMQERLAKLTGGIAVLRVGAATETELKEKKDRIEDALHATRAAVEEGIVPGGGVAYLRARTALTGLAVQNDDQKVGVDIVCRALRLPLATIAQNAGKTGEVVVNTVMLYGPDKADFGYDAQNDRYVNMFDAGIIDPTKVVRVALENAASIAGLFLTTEGVVAESAEEKAAMEEMLNRSSAS